MFDARTLDRNASPGLPGMADRVHRLQIVTGGLHAIRARGDSKRNCGRFLRERSIRPLECDPLCPAQFKLGRK